jgi:hypothetical protein
MWAESRLPVHLRDAEQLLEKMDSSNTSYKHWLKDDPLPPWMAGQVIWESPGFACHTDCSGLVNNLFMHGYGYTPEAFQRWFGRKWPKADRYFDAFQSSKGFLLLLHVGDLQPGDLIALKYLKKTDNTGHLMIVEEAPKRFEGGPPFVAGTDQWLVTVIDSSNGPHGGTDSRSKRGLGGKDLDGLGRGVFRLYSDKSGNVAGYSWSARENSRFVGPDLAPVAFGRLIPDFQP